MTALTRVYFAVVGLVGMVTGIVLLASPDNLDDYFVYPIDPGLTPIFMGAGYLGTGVTLLLCVVLARSWAEVRILVPPIATFSVSMLVVTILHSPGFHWDRPVTWLWVGLYVAIVVGAIALEVTEGRPIGPALPLDSRLRATLMVIGAATGIWAVVLFVMPAIVAPIWPWDVGELEGRIVAGWIGVSTTLTVVAALQGDVRSVRLPAIGWAITVACFIITGLTHFGGFGGFDARVAVYFVGLGLSLIGSLWLVRRAQALSPV